MTWLLIIVNPTSMLPPSPVIKKRPLNWFSALMGLISVTLPIVSNSACERVSHSARERSKKKLSARISAARSLSDLGSAAAKTPERSLFHRLFGQYLDIDAANPAKSVLVQLFFRYRRPKSDRLLASHPSVEVASYYWFTRMWNPPLSLPFCVPYNPPLTADNER